MWNQSACIILLIWLIGISIIWHKDIQKSSLNPLSLTKDFLKRNFEGKSPSHMTSIFYYVSNGYDKRNNHSFLSIYKFVWRNKWSKNPRIEQREIHQTNEGTDFPNTMAVRLPPLKGYIKTTITGPQQVASRVHFNEFPFVLDKFRWYISVNKRIHSQYYSLFATINHWCNRKIRMLFSSNNKYMRRWIEFCLYHIWWEWWKEIKGPNEILSEL